MEIKELIKEIKAKYPKIKIILGGPEVSFNAEELLKENDNIDYIISGEGEKPLPILLDSIINKTSSLVIGSITTTPFAFGLCAYIQGLPDFDNVDFKSKYLVW